MGIHEEHPRGACIAGEVRSGRPLLGREHQGERPESGVPPQHLRRHRILCLLRCSHVLRRLRLQRRTGEILVSGVQQPELQSADLNKLLSFDESAIRTITENAVEQANASLGGEDPAVQIENIDKQTVRLKKMIERSYRDNIAGALSDDIQEEMVKKFSREIEELAVRRKKLVEGETAAKEIRSAYGLFFDLAKRYTCVKALDREILHTFIERIEIGEKILPEGRKVAGARTPYRQSIRIFYRFIGEMTGDDLRHLQGNRDREEAASVAGM